MKHYSITIGIELDPEKARYLEQDLRLLLDSRTPNNTMSFVEVKDE